MGTKNKCGKPVNNGRKAMFGLAIVAAGVLLMMFNLGHIDKCYKPLIFSWQSLLVVLGLIYLFSRDSWHTGLILMSVGGVFLLPKLNILEFNVWEMVLPIGLVVAGVIVIFKKGCSAKVKFEQTAKEVAEEILEEIRNTPSTDKLEVVNIFSGGRRIITDPVFKGGKVINVFGGLELDLRQTNLEADETVLESVNIFGGIILIVPPDWNIQPEFVSILGGFADKRESAIGFDGKKLIIKGVNIFGGGEIKSTVWVKS
jgi:predicted membrane protein